MNAKKIFLLTVLLIILFCLKKTHTEHFNNLFWDEVYLLNIPRLEERRKYMLKEFEKNDLNPEIHYGVDKNKINTEYLDNLLNQGKINQNYYDKVINNKKGTLACLLTHCGLWEKLKQSRNNHFLIFEDDCHILPDFKEKARRYLKEVPDDWDMVWLGHGKLKGKKISKNVLVPENNPGAGYNALHHCYMIKKNSIDKILNIIFPLKENISKDSIIRKNFDKFKAYFIVESLASQDRVNFRVSERQK